jgi:hypothetical protein
MPWIAAGFHDGNVHALFAHVIQGEGGKSRGPHGSATGR